MQLILSQEEKDAALWSDIDDASLGRLAKANIVAIQNADRQRGRIMGWGALTMLCCQFSGGATLKVKGLTEHDLPLGDFEVTIKRVQGGDGGHKA